MERKSLTNNFTLLSMYKKKYLDSLLAYDMLAAVISSGIYDLEKNNIIKIADGNEKKTNDKKIDIISVLPEELNYLNQLYTAIEDSKNKTIHEVALQFVEDLFTHKYENYSKDIVENLIMNKVIEEKKKKGLLGIEKSIYSFAEEKIENLINSLHDELLDGKGTDEELLLLAHLLDKTGSLVEYFSKDEVKKIKENIKKYMNQASVVLETLTVINQIFLYIIALRNTATT